MWQPRSLSELPLILCGPMLRRVEPAGVTVFVALKEARKVTLRVYAGSATTARQTGTRSTVALGDNLHVVAVTSSGDALASGTLHRYGLWFGAPGQDGTPVPESQPGLLTAGVVHATADGARQRLVYGTGASDLPSFATPPADPGRLRLLHGSCRKPHGGGRDMMPVIDDLIAASAADPLERPHELLLTGDQIYADDVADPLLAIIQANAKTLKVRPETLPNRKGTGLLTDASIAIGQRTEVCQKEAGLTAGEVAKSHLLTLAEYTGMYLLVWADALWPAAVPEFGDIFPAEKRALGPTYDDIVAGKPFSAIVMPSAAKRLRRWLDETTRLNGFALDLEKVQRVLANVPTLMIFDDHEVTDDWFLNRRWCEDAAILAGDKGSALGRRVIQNGLTAYALFQAWGNTPARFAAAGAEGEKGRVLLEKLAQWDGKEGAASTDIAARVGVLTGIADGLPQRSADALDYHYDLKWERYHLVVLDTRTRRGFPDGREDPPALVYDDKALAAMLGAPGDLGPDALTIVVSAAPVIGVPLLEDFIQPLLSGKSHAGKVLADAEAWGLNHKGLYALLPRLFAAAPKDAAGVHNRRVVVLGGDVHYGFGARMRFSCRLPFVAAKENEGLPREPVEGVLAQLVSSSMLNEEGKTEWLHDWGYIPFAHLIAHKSFVGWVNKEGAAVQVGLDAGFGLGAPVPWRVSGTPAVDYLSDARLLTELPDWRGDVRYLKHEEDDPQVTPRPGVPRPVEAPTADRQQALAQYLNAASNHRDYMGKWGNGKELVGLVNVGELRFEWGDGDRKTASQTLWWRLPGQVEAAPLTRVVADLALGASLFEPPLYGGYTLRSGDKDASGADPPVYGGVKREGYTGPKHVEALQRDLLELGFAFVPVPTGKLDRETVWAVRELQGYARGPRVARDTNPTPRPPRRLDALESVELPEDDRYQGFVHGRADLPTQRVIRRWKEAKWRCPVVVEAWKTSGGQRTQIVMLPASGGLPAGPADNLWRHAECTDTAATFFAADLSGRLTNGLPPASPPPLVPLAGYDPRAGASGWGGPLADPAKGHTRRAGEILPETMLPRSGPGLPGPSLAVLVADRGGTGDAAQLARRRLSTFKVVRAVGELRTSGYLDALRAHDEDTLTLGAGGWSAGRAKPPTEVGPPKPEREWKVDPGQLAAFAALVRRVDDDAFQRAFGDFGAGSATAWGSDGKALLDDSRRILQARMSLTDEDGRDKAIGETVADHDYLRSWHWIYRCVAAAREVDGVRRQMWPFARQRIADVLAAPWDPPDGPKTVPDLPKEGGGTRPATIGDVLTSERGIACLLAWHHLVPADMVSPGPDTEQPPEKRAKPRAATRLRAAFTRATGGTGAPSFAGAPDTWTDAHETAILAGLLAEAATVPAVKAGVEAVRDWPRWTNSAGDAITPANPLGFALPLTALPAAERNLLTARGSFALDTSGLPRTPA